MQIVYKYRSILLSLLIFFIVSCAGRQKESAPQDKQNFDHINYDWSIKALNGQKINFTLFEKKVVFFNIWATWCAPCVEELPGIQQLYNSMKSEQIEFVLASAEDPALIDAFLKKNQITLPVYIYSSNLPNVLKSEYIPRTYIIDRYGKIVYKKIGQFRWNTQDMKEFLRFLINVKIKE